VFPNPANNCLAKMGSFPLVASIHVRIFYCCYSLVLNVGNPGNPETGWNAVLDVFDVLDVADVLDVFAVLDSDSLTQVEDLLLVQHTDLSCYMFLFL
jgi:hypothetical protein